MKETKTTEEVAARFMELAEKEQWFEIQDELFADHVRSVEPAGAQYLQSAEGKANVRKKASEFVANIEAFHSGYTSKPTIGGSHFAVGRGMDITIKDAGRIRIDQVMLYEVQDGLIVLEQFFY